MPLFTIVILVFSTIPIAASAPSLHGRPRDSVKLQAEVKNTTVSNDRKQHTQSEIPSAENSNPTSNYPSENVFAHNTDYESGGSWSEVSENKSITTKASVEHYYDMDDSKELNPLCGFGEAVSSLWPRIELRRFAEQDRCASVEWQRLDESDNDDSVTHLWKAVVGTGKATMKEMLDDLEGVFITVYKQRYSFRNNSKNTTLYDNYYRLALDIQTPLNADDLEKIENLCQEVLPREPEKGLIFSVDLELKLNSSTAFNIITQLPCLLSKKPVFRISGLRMSITNVDEDGKGYFTITGVNKKIDEGQEGRPIDSNLVVLCDNRVDAGGKIISRDGYHCRTTIELLQH